MQTWENNCSDLVELLNRLLLTLQENSRGKKIYISIKIHFSSTGNSHSSCQLFIRDFHFEIYQTNGLTFIKVIPRFLLRPLFSFLFFTSFIDFSRSWLAS